MNHGISSGVKARGYCRVIAVMALCLVCSCGSGGTDTNSDDAGNGGTASSDAGFAQQCVDKINAYRATVGLAALARWTEGEGCADEEAASDAASGEFHGAFGSCGEHAQNECPDYDSTTRILELCLQMMWDEGPGGGHYDNMTSTDSAQVACGIHTTAEGLVWSVQNFR